MNRDLMLQRIANVIFIVSGIVLSVVVVQRYVLTPTARAAVYKPGDQLFVPGVKTSGNTPTLVLVLNSRCKFCNESVAFYRKLIEASRSRAIQIAIVGHEDTATLQGYVARHHLSVPQVQSISPASLPVGTPTLFLVDGESRVVRVWRGVLSENQEREVLAIAERATSSPRSAGL